VHHLEEIAYLEGQDGYAFDIARDITRLRNFLRANRKIKIIIIDPWLNYLGKKNGYSAQEVRQVLMPLQATARELELVILAIAHFKKGSGEKANDRIGGSAAIVQVPRSVLLVDARHDTGGTVGEIHQTKHNLNPHGKAKQYKLITADSIRNGKKVRTSKLTWGGESQKDAEVVFAAKDPKERQIDLCCSWLSGYLNDSEAPASEVLERGKRKGFSNATIWRAFHVLRVQSRKDKKQNLRAFWSLP
jgi:hypothetical protein